MRELIFNLVFKNIVVKFLVEKLDQVSAKLGPNGKKTLYGVIVTALGGVVAVFPQTTPFIAPVLELVKPHAAEIVLSGFGYTAFGIFHKGLKWLKDKLDK